jgi:hypothetical protein
MPLIQLAAEQTEMGVRRETQTYKGHDQCKRLMHAFSTYENYNIGKEIALY